MRPPADAHLVRALVEHATAHVDYRRAQVELVGKLCGVVIAVLGFGAVLVGAATAILM